MNFVNMFDLPPYHVNGSYCGHCGLVAPNVLLYDCCKYVKYCSINCQISDRERHQEICPPGQTETNRVRRVNRKSPASVPRHRRNQINGAQICQCPVCIWYYCYGGCTSCLRQRNTDTTDSDTTDYSESETDSPRRNHRRIRRRKQVKAFICTIP